MTVDSSSSSNGSPLPPEHRPQIDAMAKETAEEDLWALDKASPEVREVVSEPAAPSIPKGFFIPEPRLVAKPKLRPTDEPMGSTEGNEGVQMNVGKSRPAFYPPSPLLKPESEFDELDDWDDFEPVSKPGNSPEPAPVPVQAASQAKVNPEISILADKEEFSPPNRTGTGAAPFRPVLGFSKLEKIGLIFLLALLVLGGGGFFLKSIGSLPTSSIYKNEVEFPIEGQHLAVFSAKTFWRVPVTTGETPDTVRRGTRLIPVVTLQAGGKAGAVRVFFRNSEGNRIGDAVTRPVTSEVELEFAATAGFNEAWMHDAYRTSDGKPWTIEVREAPSEDSPVSEFKLLFEMNISSERR